MQIAPRLSRVFFAGLIPSVRFLHPDVVCRGLLSALCETPLLSRFMPARRFALAGGRPVFFTGLAGSAWLAR
jgi:hypothetical protein